MGFVGTGLTFAAWGMRGAIALRAFGIASSVAFLSFGLLSETWPVVATELVLLPLNAFRLWQLLAERRSPGAVALPLEGAPRSAVDAGSAVRHVLAGRDCPDPDPDPHRSESPDARRLAA